MADGGDDHGHDGDGFEGQSLTADYWSTLPPGKGELMENMQAQVDAAFAQVPGGATDENIRRALYAGALGFVTAARALGVKPDLIAEAFEDSLAHMGLMLVECAEHSMHVVKIPEDNTPTLSILDGGKKDEGETR